MKLSDMIAEIWDRAHHVFPKYAPRKLLTWTTMTESRALLGTDESEITTVPFPAKWAADTGKTSENVNWGEGVWS